MDGRKGFKPTVLQKDAIRQDITSINTAAIFGAFLAERRREFGSASDSTKLVVMHPRISAETLSQLESGVFSAPLDAVFSLADFYQIDRSSFLDCVMRVFYSEELKILRQETRA